MNMKWIKTLIMCALITAGCGGKAGEAGGEDLSQEETAAPVEDVGLEAVLEVVTPDVVDTTEMVDAVEAVDAPEDLDAAELEEAELVTLVVILEILAPEQDAVNSVGEAVPFQGKATDEEGGGVLVEVEWVSDLDGQFHQGVTDDEGFIEFDSYDLTAGTHEITLRLIGDAVEGDDVSISLLMNTPPVTPGLTITPAEPATTDELTAIPDGEASDADGDEVTTTVEWFKDGDKQDELTGEYVVPPVHTAKGQTWSAVLKTNDGYAFGAVSQDKVSIQNTLPSLAAAVVTPQEGYVDTTFTCSAEGWVDPDGAPEQFAVAWSLNGLIVEGETTADLAPGLFKKADEVSCQLTPFDEEGDGESVASNVVVVQNTLPSGGAAALAPELGTVDTEFTCSPEGSTDLDGDEVTYLYSWVVNDEVLPGNEAPSIFGSAVGKGKNFYCLVTPVDGEGEGEQFDSNPAAVVNTPPTVEGAQPGPEGANGETPLVCDPVNPFDADGDDLSYIYGWYVNGVLVEGETGPGLSPDHFAKDDEVTCLIVPYDGEEQGDTVVTAEPLIIANSPPSLKAAMVEPEVGNELELFFCTAQGWEDPDGDIFEVAFSWKVNGEEVAEAWEGFLSGEEFDKGDEVVCVVTPKNGDETGPSVSSEPALVGNAPPFVASASVDPMAGPSTITFHCVPEGLGDPDAVDEPWVEYQWLANGETIDGETEETVAGSAAGKGVILTCLVTPYDEEGPGTPVESGTAMVVNTAPNILSVSVQPESGSIYDQYECVPFGWLDPDGDPPTYEFQWFIDGQLVEGLEEPLLSGVQLIPDMEIVCKATPTDDIGKGMTMTSEPALVVNSAPSIEGVELTPAPAFTEDTLSCEPFGWSDADGDPEQYAYQWVKNEGFMDGENSSTLAPDKFVAGQKLECRVVPFDGWADGVPVFSNPVVIQNTAPVLGAAGLTPPEGNAETVFTCLPLDWFDLDGDPEGYLYQWTVNGDPVPDYGEATITTPFIKKGDVVACRVTPFDGVDEGQPVFTAELTIGNVTPELAEVTVSPVAPATDATLICTPAGWSDPDGDEEGYLYQWNVNDEAVPGEEGDTLAGEHFVKHDEVSCAATPTDGLSQGQTVVSPAVTVINTPPAMDDAALNPGSAGRLDLLTCLPGEVFDLDEDEVEPLYEWLIDGELVPGEEEESFVPAAAEPGSEVVCRVTPFDGDDEGAPVAAGPAVIFNKLPSITGVAVGPDPLYTDTSSQCLPEGWLDEDNDPEQYKFDWFVDGGELPGEVGDSLAADSFVKHQFVHCVATPFDGYDDGEPVIAPPVEVANSLPVVASAAVDPAEGTKGNTFTCIAGQASDADGDDVTVAFQWLADGLPVPGQTAATWLPSSQVAGTGISCVVLPDDGEQSGKPVTSEAVVLGNTAPSIGSVTLSPDEIYTDTKLTCTAEGVEDFESDQVTLAYAWFVDEVELPGEALKTLEGDLFAKHQAVRCEVTPDDGLVTGDAVSSDPSEVLNSIPSKPVVSVTPDAPETTQALTCSVADPSIDADDDNIEYAFSWFKDDELVAGADSGEVADDETKECETWRCQVCPADDEVTGPCGTAEETVQGGNEVCDGHDNNCNGEVDEGFNTLLLPCGELDDVTTRMPVVIDGTASWELTDFQVRVALDHQDGMQADFGDLRFTAADGKTLLSFWTESYSESASAIFWVEVDSIPAQPGSTTIYVYWGNAQAANLSDIHTAFLFGDDFEDSDWTAANWNTVLGSWSVSDGIFIGTGDDAVTRSAAVIPEESRVMEGRMRTKSGGDQPWDMGWMHIKYKDESNDVYGLIYQGGSGYTSGDAGITVEYGGAGTFYDTKDLDPPPPLIGGEWNDFKLAVNGVNAKLWVNGQLYINADNSNIANLVSSYTGVAAHDCTAWFDNVRLRKFAPADPTGTAGSPEGLCVPVCE